MRGVYRLTCDDPDLIYYGSSDNIYRRETKHKYNHKKWKEDNANHYCSSYKLYEVGGVEVEIIFECPDDISKLEMREIEQTYIDNDECINEVKAFMTEQQRIEYFKEYKKEYNKSDKVKEYQKNINKLKNIKTNKKSIN